MINNKTWQQHTFQAETKAHNSLGLHQSPRRIFAADKLSVISKHKQNDNTNKNKSLCQ
jgi:hypothetical protein